MGCMQQGRHDGQAGSCRVADTLVMRPDDDTDAFGVLFCGQAHCGNSFRRGLEHRGAPFLDSTLFFVMHSGLQPKFKLV